MSEPIDTYSRKGFLRVLAFAAVVAGVGALMSWLTAPESVSCIRNLEGEIDCKLVRLISGSVPVRTEVVSNLTAVRIETYTPRRRIGDPRTGHGPAHKLRLVGSAKSILSVQSSYDDLEDVRRKVAALGNTPGSLFATTIAGSPRAHFWSVAALNLGLSLVPLWILGYFVPALRPARPRNT